MLLLAGCKKEYFTIDGSMSDGGTQNIRAVYVTDYETLQSEWITMTDGQFELKGINYDWTIVYLINNKRDIIARAAVKNGDNITITGSMADPYHTTVEGNDANEEWSHFMTENAELYSDTDRSKLNSAIEKYVESNPDRISSTLLLLNDYAAGVEGATDVDSLFKHISIDARPSGLVNNYFALSQQLDTEKSNNNIQSIMLYNSEDTITTFFTSRYRATVMYFWNKNDAGRADAVKALKQLYEKHEKGGRLQVVDILMSPDTIGWKRTLQADSTDWKHFWAPGSSLNRNLVTINVGNTPYFIVASAMGKQIYRGTSAGEAVTATDGLLK